MVSWVYELVGGLKPENLNIEMENQNKAYERRLSVQQIERQKQLL